MSEQELPLLGYFLTFRGSDVPKGYEGNFYQVIEAEPIQFETGREQTAIFAAVASGGSSGWLNVELLEPDTDHLYYILWGIQDGCRYYVKIPTGKNRLGLDDDKDIGYVDNLMSPWLGPNPLFSFWLVHNMFPAFDVENDTPLSLTPKIWFWGMKYGIAKVADGELIDRMKNYLNGKGGQAVRVITLGGMK